MADTCETCIYWLRNNATMNGRCRCRPPAATGSKWPTTMSDEWCGVYEAPAAPEPEATPRFDEAAQIILACTDIISPETAAKLASRLRQPARP